MTEIVQWLKTLGLDKYIPIFERHEIDLESLAWLSADDLEEMGIALGPRKKILNAIAASSRSEIAGSIPSAIPKAERRHLTILFCDMVASTEYAYALDPEDFRHVMGNFLQTCGSVVRRHNGMVANYVGDAIKAFFGYPVAAEDDAERALLAGLEILDEVAKLKQVRGQSLQVRLGVASGEVVVGNFIGAPEGIPTDAFGHAIHLAARLQTLAEPGTMLADAATFQAADGAIEFDEFGRHSLKGVADPVCVWRARQALPLHSRFARRPQLTKMVDRDEEMQQLITCWEEVTVSGQGDVMIVAGEPGIGKSRLLHELQLRQRISNQLMFQCSSAFENSTLHPFLTELRRQAGIEEDKTAASRLRRLKHALSVSTIPIETALPVFAKLMSIPYPERDALIDVSVERQRAVTKQVLIDWIAHIASTQPLLILFEDVQWVDRTSLELLDMLIEHLSSVPALVLVSIRIEHETLLSGREGLPRLHLTPLNNSDARALICEMDQSELPSEDVMAFILHRAEGLPLYLEELTKGAMALGLSLNQSTATIGPRESEIPSSLQSWLLARLDRLGPAREIAQIAATIGREFSIDLLREISELDNEEVNAALASLMSAGLIVPKEDGRGQIHIFKHALLQQAAEGTLLREHSMQLHTLIAEAMEQRDHEALSSYPEILAQHYTEGGVFDRAADCWLRAGVKAGKTWAKVEAARMFANGIAAAERLPESAERDRQILKLELERGDVLYAALGYVTSEGTEAYNRAIRLSQELNDPEASIRAHDGLFGTHLNSCRYLEAATEGDKLIEIGRSHDNLKALVLGLQFKGMSLFSRGQLTSARLHLEQALEHAGRAQEVGSDFPSMAMIYLSWALQVLGEQDQALARFREAEPWVRRGAPYHLAAWLGDGCILFAMRNEGAIVSQMADELLPLANENGFNLWTNMAHIFRGWAMAEIEGTKAWTASTQEAIQALENQEVDKSCYLGLLGSAYLRTGELEKAAETVRQGLDHAKKFGEHYYTAELLRLRGEVELRLDCDTTLAEASFREAMTFAKGQAAKSWELKAAESLTQLVSLRSNSTRGKQKILPD